MIPTPHPPRVAAQNRQTATDILRGHLAPAPTTAPALSSARSASSSARARIRERLLSDPLATPAWIAALALAGMCCAVGWWTIRIELAMWNAGRVLDAAREQMWTPRERSK